MLGLGVVLGGIGLTRNYWAVMALSALSGALLFGLMATLATSLQYLIDDYARGRVMALYGLAWAGLVPVGGLLLGMIGGLMGPASAIIAAGVATALAGAIIAFVFRSETIISSAGPAIVSGQRV
jgi:hypothetical protein